MTEELVTLKTHVSAILPMLDANLQAAHDEWMAGNIAKGVFEYCRHRHLLALDIIAMDVDKVDEESAFKAGATLFIDLRSAIKDVPVGQRDSEQAKIDSMHQFYIQHGFTDTNVFLNIPIRPEPAGINLQVEEPQHV